MTAAAARVAIIGATGYTGRLVAQALRDRAIPFVLAGRNRDKLRALAERLGGAAQSVCDVTDPDSLEPVLASTRVVVSCAGPFTQLGEPVVSACAARGVHYLDTTGEQPFVRMVYERYDATARLKGCALVPSFAFESAIGDAAAALAARDLGPLDEVAITYAMAGFGMSRGTQRSALVVLGGEGWTYQDGRLVAVRPASEKRVVALPQPPGPRPAILVPYPEVLTVPRHIETRHCKTFFVGTPRFVALMRMLTPIAAHAGRRLRGFLERRISAGPEGPSENDRIESRFTIHVEARGPGGHRTAIVRGRDPYGLTGQLCALGAQHLLAPDFDKVGALAPSQAVAPEAIFEAVRRYGVSIEVG